MVRDAEANASTDKDKRDKIDLKNQADSLAYQAEKQLSDLGDKVSADDKTKVEAGVKSLREAIQAENFDQIQTLKTELEQTLYQITTNLYQQAGGEGGAPGAEAPGPEGGSASGGEDVIDADFTESK
jgi:molecular chaperone DnaK